MRMGTRTTNEGSHHEFISSIPGWILPEHFFPGVGLMPNRYRVVGESVCSGRQHQFFNLFFIFKLHLPSFAADQPTRGPLFPSPTLLRDSVEQSKIPKVNNRNSNKQTPKKEKTKKKQF